MSPNIAGTPEKKTVFKKRLFGTIAIAIAHR